MATGKRSRLPQSLTICTQLDLQGERLEVCVVSALDFVRAASKIEKCCYVSIALKIGLQM